MSVMKDEKICSKCGNYNKQIAKFCAFCGESFKMDTNESLIKQNETKYKSVSSTDTTNEQTQPLNEIDERENYSVHVQYFFVPNRKRY